MQPSWIDVFLLQNLNFDAKSLSLRQNMGMKHRYRVVGWSSFQKPIKQRKDLPQKGVWIVAFIRFIILGWHYCLAETFLAASKQKLINILLWSGGFVCNTRLRLAYITQTLSRFTFEVLFFTKCISARFYFWDLKLQ